MTLTIRDDGTVQALYTDDVDMRELGLVLGSLGIRRASRVEPTSDGRWDADMTPVGGPASLGPFNSRQAALAAEIAWLEREVLA
jgi:hypothetical protein